MTNKSRSARFGLCFVLTGAILAAAWASPALRAQPATNVAVKFYGSPSPPSSDKAHSTLELRPNVEQEAFLFLYNLGDEIKLPVTVELRAGGKPVATSKLAGLPKGTHLVSFAPPAPLPPGTKPPPPAELQGNIDVVAYTDKDKPLGDRCIVGVGRPDGFLDVATPQFDIKTRTLTVKVTANNKFSGPPCVVELDLRPSRIPFLVPRQKAVGSYRKVLLQAGDSTLLEARNLQLQESEASGLVYITVDGYQRAFTYRFTNASGEAAQLTSLNDRPILRLLADPVAASDGSSKVGVEADNLTSGSKIELGLYKDNSFKPETRDGELLEFEGSRRTQISFSPLGPRGGLLFQTRVADWTTKLDTAKVFGDRIIRVQLFQEKEPVNFTGALNNGPLSARPVAQVTAGLLVDGTPPEDVQFVDFPKELVRGTPLTVKATGRDDESGIGKVVFFVGKLPPDGKIPPTAIQAVGEKVKDKALWVADLPVATEKATTLEVSVQFTNNVGLSETPPPVVIKLVDAKAATATIKGEVVEGERPQAGLEVVLRDPQGSPKDKTKTDDAGKFVFKDVAPGQYQIVVQKTGSKTKGQAVVQVGGGEEKVLSDPIKLTR